VTLPGMFARRSHGYRPLLYLGIDYLISPSRSHNDLPSRGELFFLTWGAENVTFPLCARACPRYGHHSSFFFFFCHCVPFASCLRRCFFFLCHQGARSLFFLFQGRGLPISRMNSTTLLFYGSRFCVLFSSEARDLFSGGAPFVPLPREYLLTLREKRECTAEHAKSFLVLPPLRDAGHLFSSPGAEKGKGSERNDNYYYEKRRHIFFSLIESAPPAWFSDSIPLSPGFA